MIINIFVFSAECKENLNDDGKLSFRENMSALLVSYTDMGQGFCKAFWKSEFWRE